MLLEEIRNIKSEKRDLRNFGLVMGVVLSIIGGALLWRGRETYPYILGLAAFFAVTGLIVPVLLKPIQKAWMALAVVLGFVMTRVILSVLFYLAITPLSLVMRLMGKRFVLGGRDETITYWHKRKHEDKTTEDYERQF